MKTKAIKVIAIVLSLALLFSLPVSAQDYVNEAVPKTIEALDAHAHEQWEKEQADETPVVILQEEEGKRTQSEKHFLMSDGRYMAVTYKNPVHYKDKTGKYTEYDNSLVQTGKGYKSVSSDKNIMVGTPDWMAQIESDGHIISWNYESKETNKINVKNNKKKDKKVVNKKINKNNKTKKQIKEEKEKIEEDSNAPFTEMSTATSQATYENIYKNVDVEINVLPEGIKDNVILKNKNAKTEFNISYDIGDLTAKQVDGKTINLLDQQGKVVYVIEAPMMMDADGKVSGALTLKMQDGNNQIPSSTTVPQTESETQTTTVLTTDETTTQEQTATTAETTTEVPTTEVATQEATTTAVQPQKEISGKLVVTLQADKSWLKEKDRKFPVIVDPATKSGQNKDNINDVSVFEKSINSYTVPDGSVYVGEETSKYGKARGFVKINELPTLGAGDMVVSAELAYVTITKKWASPSMHIEAHEITKSWNPASYHPSSSTYVNYWGSQPEFSSYIVDSVPATTSTSQINFDITTLVKGWYNGTKTNYGVALKAKDETSGAHIILADSDLRTDGNDWRPTIFVYYLNNKGLEPIWTYTEQSAGVAGVGHVNDYTGNLVFSSDVVSTPSNQPFTFNIFYNGYKEDTAHCVKNGYGWTNTLSQHIEFISDGTGNKNEQFLYDQGYRLLYEDADGTDHYFKEKEKEPGIFEDETGNGFKYNYSTGYLEDKGGNKIKFTSGELQWFKPYNSDKAINVTITKDAKGIATSAVVSDVYGKRLEFSFDSSFIHQIKDSAGRYTTFSYSGGRLSKILYPDGSYAEYQYNSDGNLNFAGSGADNVGISYEYYTGSEHRKNQVKKVTEKSAVSSGARTIGNSLSFTYHTTASGTTVGNSTMFTDSEGRKTTYNFDNYGKTMDINDSDGNVASYSYSSAKNSTSGANNKVMTSVANTKPIINMAKNHGFENGVSSWTALPTGSSIAEYTGAANGGYKSGKVTRTTTGDAYLVQNVTVRPNFTYTLSGDLRIISGTTGSGAHMKATTSGGGMLGETTAELTPAGLFNRQSVTFNTGDNTLIKIWVGIKNSNGGAYADNIQLEEGYTENNYNLLENGGFDWESFDGWSKSGACDSNDKLISTSKGNSFEMNGDVTKEKYVSQKIRINKKNPAFKISGQAYGKSKPIKDSSNFRIVLELYYSDGETEWCPVNFTAETELGWQYISAQAKTQRAENKGKVVTDVIFYVMYYKNVNFQYFDSMQLQIDETGTSYSYDSNGDLLSAEDGAGRAESYEKSATDKDKDGPITKYTDIEGVSHSYTYDSTYKYRIKDATNNYYNRKTSTTYDSYGNVTKVTSKGTEAEAEAQISTSTYDTSKGQLTSSTDTLGNKTSYNYNGNTGTLISTTDAKNSVTNYTYNSDNDSLASVSKTFKKVNDTATYTAKAEYGYTSVTKRLANIKAGNVSYYFNYDLFGNTENIKVGGRNLITHEYEKGNGNLKTSTYGNGNYIEYVYDDLDRPTSQKWNGTTAYTWLYNKDGNIAKSVDNTNGLTYNYRYDLSGRLTKSTRSDEFDAETAYSSISKVNSQKYSLNGSARKTTYEYNKGGLAQKTTFNNTATKEFVMYGANDSLSYTKLQAPGQTATYNVNYGYQDGMNGTDKTTSRQISSVMQGKSSVAESAREKWYYQYDDLGNITRIFKSGDSTKYYSFTYDELNQLTTYVDNVSKTAERYIYDTHGNITSKQTLDINNLSTVLSTVPYTYGDSGWGDLLTNFNGTAITYDTIGNPLTMGTKKFTWEHGRQLKSYTDGSVSASYKYDQGGIRTSKTVGGVTTKYYTSGSTVVAQQTGSNTPIWYHYDNNGQRVSIEYNGTNYYYVYNLQGDVIALLNSTYDKVVEYSYDAWGKQTSCTGSLASTLGKDNPFRYRGYYYDNENGYYYLNSRYYDPNMGRFINADSLVQTGQSITDKNMFAYCNNNPANRSDPSGNISVDDMRRAWMSGSDEYSLVDMVGAKKQEIYGSSSTTQSPGISTGYDIMVDLLGITNVGVNRCFVPAVYKSAARPANIGVGTYAKQTAKMIEKYGNISLGLDSVLDKLAYAGVAISAGENAYVNYKNGESVEKITWDLGMDISMGIATTMISIDAATQVGAVVGTFIGGPVGTFVGAIAGAGVGMAIGWVGGKVTAWLKETWW